MFIKLCVYYNTFLMIPIADVKRNRMVRSSESARIASSARDAREHASCAGALPRAPDHTSALRRRHGRRIARTIVFQSR